MTKDEPVINRRSDSSKRSSCQIATCMASDEKSSPPRTGPIRHKQEAPVDVVNRSKTRSDWEVPKGDEGHLPTVFRRVRGPVCMNRDDSTRCETEVASELLEPHQTGQRL